MADFAASKKHRSQDSNISKHTIEFLESILEDWVANDQGQERRGIEGAAAEG